MLQARREGRQTATASLDLGLTTVAVRLEPNGVVFPDGERVSWDAVQYISNSKASGRLSDHCFLLENGAPSEISFFSKHTNRFYSLLPTGGAPTMVISGFPMHRIKGTDPHRDTLLKMKAAAPVLGKVLDTATGLGYTAIEAAKTAREVVTIELDGAALEIARLNPWSRDLFDNPRIRQVVGDSAEEIGRFESGSFDRIIHDPPAFSLAGDLYSGAFYRELYRALKRNGRVFHYIGNPESASGERVTRGVIRRLKEAGFTRVVTRSEAFGLVAYK